MGKSTFVWYLVIGLEVYRCVDDIAAVLLLYVAFCRLMNGLGKPGKKTVLAEFFFWSGGGGGWWWKISIFAGIGVQRFFMPA